MQQEATSHIEEEQYGGGLVLTKIQPSNLFKGHLPNHPGPDPEPGIVSFSAAPTCWPLKYVPISPSAGTSSEMLMSTHVLGVNPSSQASCTAILTAGAGETCLSSHLPSQVGPRDLEETTGVW